MCVCVCVCMLCMCVCVCVRSCVPACVRHAVLSWLTSLGHHLVAVDRRHHPWSESLVWGPWAVRNPFYHRELQCLTKTNHYDEAMLYCNNTTLTQVNTFERESQTQPQQRHGEMCSARSKCACWEPASERLLLAAFSRIAHPNSLTLDTSLGPQQFTRQAGGRWDEWLLRRSHSMITLSHISSRSL